MKVRLERYVGDSYRTLQDRRSLNFILKHWDSLVRTADRESVTLP